MTSQIPLAASVERADEPRTGHDGAVAAVLCQRFGMGSRRGRQAVAQGRLICALPAGAASHAAEQDRSRPSFRILDPPSGVPISFEARSVLPRAFPPGAAAPGRSGQSDESTSAVMIVAAMPARSVIVRRSRARGGP